MIPIYGSYDFAGMTIFPFVLIDKAHKNNSSLRRHENIHGLQQVEIMAVLFAILFAIGGLDLWFIVPFAYYIVYFIEWVIRSLVVGDFSLFGEGYNKIGFERESNDHEEDSNYFTSRIPFNWIKYIWQ